MTQEELEEKLVTAGYRNLFFYGREDPIEEIWNEGKNKRKLALLIKSATSSLLAKFLAAEVLREYNIPFGREIKKILPEAYVKALENAANFETYQLNANYWGFLYEENDPGDLGKQIIEFGQVAVPYLIKLLDNNETPIYEGSSEATLGSSYLYRIKDFAAFYLFKITNIPIQFYHDLKKRDAEIERYKEELNKR